MTTGAQYVTIVNYLRKGKDGEPGKDGVTVRVSPDTLVFRTNDKGEIDNSSLSQSAQIKVYQGDKDITASCVFTDDNAVFVNSSGYVMIKAQTDGSVGVVKFSSVTTAATVDGHKIPNTAGYANLSIPCMTNGKTYKAQVRFAVDGGSFWGGLSSTSSGLEANYTSLSNRVGELDTTSEALVKKVGTLEVTSDRISAKVNQTEVRDRNLIPNSYVRLGSNKYGICERKVRLEKSKCYALTVWGKISPAVSLREGTLSAFVYKTDENGVWTWMKQVDINTVEDSKSTVKFDDVPSDGEYNFAAFPYPRQENGGLVYLRCAQLEEIPSSEDDATSWSAANSDPTVYGNILPQLSTGNGWTLATGSEITVGGYSVDGHSLNVLHLKANSVAVGATLKNITTGSDKSYTLSFFAKGSGAFQTLFTPNCLFAVDDTEATSTASDGSFATDRQLTSEWKRYSVTYTAGGTNTSLLIQLKQGGEMWLAGVKLEPYGRMTDYADRNISVDDIKATGIDIYNKRIDVTANQFNIYNNVGERTFSVDADGMVTMNYIALGGMFNKNGVHITSLSQFNNLFTAEKDPLTQQWLAFPVVAKMYGIYYLDEAIGLSVEGLPLRLHLPSAYVDADGYFYGDVYNSEGKLDRTKLQQIRAMVGNTVLIYNDSSEDVEVECMSPYFEDVWVKVTTKVATSGTQQATPSQGVLSPDVSEGLEKPTTNGSINPDERYAGRRRNNLVCNLTGSNHRFISLTCVCEVGSRGWENIYWLGNYGQGFDT